MIKQARVVDAFKYHGISISFLDNDSFIANTDCCTLDLDNIEEKVALVDIISDYEKEMEFRLSNCKALKQSMESEIADYIFTKLPAVIISDSDKIAQLRAWAFKTEEIERMHDMSHCDNCDEPTIPRFPHPSEDVDPIYICERCFAGETHE